MAELTNKLAVAFQFALEAHGSQKRKGTTTPYISHLMAVASLVFEYGGTEDQAVAALLHDVVEDTPIKLDVIQKAFGPTVAHIVDDCTDAETLPKPPWRDRKKRYIKHLRDEAGPDSLLVSAADKLHNARAIAHDVRHYGSEVWRRFNATPRDIVWYYKSLLKIFRRRSVEAPGMLALVQELDTAVSAMKDLAGKKSKQKSKQKSKRREPTTQEIKEGDERFDRMVQAMCANLDKAGEEASLRDKVPSPAEKLKEAQKKRYWKWRSCCGFDLSGVPPYYCRVPATVTEDGKRCCVGHAPSNMRAKSKEPAAKMLSLEALQERTRKLIVEHEAKNQDVSYVGSMWAIVEVDGKQFQTMTILGSGSLGDWQAAAQDVKAKFPQVKAVWAHLPD